MITLSDSLTRHRATITGPRPTEPTHGGVFGEPEADHAEATPPGGESRSGDPTATGPVESPPTHEGEILASSILGPVREYSIKIFDGSVEISGVRSGLNGLLLWKDDMLKCEGVIFREVLRGSSSGE